jgi:hypothetical protein
MKLVTQRAYAASKEVSPQYVSKLVKEGIVTLENGKINPGLADKQIAEFASHVHETPGPKGSNEPGDDSIASYRKKELAINISLKKLQYDEAMGLLVNSEELKFALQDLFLGIRGQILSIPTKMIGELIQIIEKGCNVKVPVAVQGQISAILRKEVHDTLEALSKWKVPGATTKTLKRRRK